MTRVHFLAVFALLAVVASCTTNQSAFLPPLPEVEAHVISGAPTAKREVASMRDETVLEARFQSLLNAQDVDQATRAKTDRLIRIFYRTQGYLNDFDSKLEELSKQPSVSEDALQTDDSYAHLILAWTLREETIETVTYFYRRANEIVHAKDDSPRGRDIANRALLVIRAIRNSIGSAANSTGRLAKQELLHSLIEVHQKPDSVTKALSKQLMEDPAEVQNFYERNQKQLQRETEAAKSDEELNQEIDAKVPELKRALAEQFEKRAPQSAGAIAPGLGRSGMMNGFEFSKGTWALTFDDGPHASYTQEVLANLKANGMKASFFWVADNVERMHSIVSQVQAAGMTLANHSYTHANLPTLGPAGLRHEIIESTTVDLRAGYRPLFFRCPYGACGSQNSIVRQKIADLNMVSVTWNVDSLDWQDKNPRSVYARVKKQMAMQKRGIILFHDIHSQSVAASKMLMTDFAAGQKKGIYRTVTIEQAFNELNSPEGMK